MHEYLAGNYQWQESCILAGKSRVVFRHCGPFLKGPATFRVLFGG